MSALEVLASARYGDVDEIRAQLLVAGSLDAQVELVNFAQEETKNTPLHMGGLCGWRRSSKRGLRCVGAMFGRSFVACLRANSMCKWTRGLRQCAD